MHPLMNSTKEKRFLHLQPTQTSSTYFLLIMMKRVKIFHSMFRLPHVSDDHPSTNVENSLNLINNLENLMG